MTQPKANGAAAETALAKPDDIQYQIFESLAIKGDVSMLSAVQKIQYLERLCQSLGLNPLTQPFAFIKLSGKEVPYALRGATDQLTFNHKLTREIIKTETIEGIFIATAKVSGPDGRFDVSTGAVPIGGIKGENLANALMKAETKAKRRATLCYCGLGFLDESELDTIPPSRIEYPTNPAAASSAPRPATKGELANKAKSENGSAAGDNILPQAEVDRLKSQIEKLGAAIGMAESAEKTIKFIDESPNEADRAYRKAARVSIRKLTESEKWPYADEGTTAYLEKHGITILDEASRGQLESLVDQLISDGLLNG